MIRRFIFLISLVFNSIFCFAVDFDVAVVGTSPFSLLEALYHYHLGKSVLILESAPECGGAWKSINICGISNADMGCHLIGRDPVIHDFLETYLGCKLVSMDDPHKPFDSTLCQNGFYPAEGCHEMIRNLVKLIKSTDIVLMLNQTLQSVVVHSETPVATLKTTDKQFTASKLILSPSSGFVVENLAYCSAAGQVLKKVRHSHLYLLIEDATEPRFSYHQGVDEHMSRMMNMTPFVGLEGTGQQLIVFQINCEPSPDLAQRFLNVLQEKELVDVNAKYLKSESYVYEHPQCPFALFQQVKNAHLVFELLDTYALHQFVNYIPKWKKVLKPYKEMVLE